MTFNKIALLGRFWGVPGDYELAAYLATLADRVMHAFTVKAALPMTESYPMALPTGDKGERTILNRMCFLAFLFIIAICKVCMLWPFMIVSNKPKKKKKSSGDQNGATLI